MLVSLACQADKLLQSIFRVLYSVHNVSLFCSKKTLLQPISANLRVEFEEFVEFEELYPRYSN